jgi:penicillin amidase
MVVDGKYPHFLSADMENPCRAQRAVELITSKPALSIEDCARFQLDTYSAQAQRFVRQMLTVQAESDDERQALAYLKSWDGHMDAGSVAASLYQVSRLRTLHLAFDGHLGHMADSYLGLDDVTPLGVTNLYYGRSIVRLLDLLEDSGDEGWLRDPTSGRLRSRQTVLHQALREALDLLQGELGPEMSRWTWGRLNRLAFTHPLGSVKPLHLLFNRGPYPAGGDHDTLLRASGRPEFPFPPVLAGDALRFVADLSDWEKCCIVVPGGQSGHAASRHYADLIPLWRAGRFQPMPFGQEAVEAQTVQRLVLAPVQ